MAYQKIPTQLQVCIAGVLLTGLLAFTGTTIRAQDDHAMHSAHAGHDMPGSAAETISMNAAHEAKLLADKKESELNHHLAGLFVILAGILVLAQGTLSQRWAWLRFAWPACFLLSGLFLLVFSDTELWPFGPQSWWYGLTHHREDLQHKTFAVILLTLGGIELQRIRGVLTPMWTAWVFPVLAFCGSVMLLFHEHNAGMHGGMSGHDHMDVMARIQAEHLNFAVAGFGIGLFKGLAEAPVRWRRIATKIWPMLMIALGVLLMRYTE